VVDDAIRIVS